VLSEAQRDRLAKPVVRPQLLKEYKEATGERLEKGVSPTWEEFIAAKMAHRAAMNATGTRDTRELLEASEQEGSESGGKPAYQLSMRGLPRTNAVTGEAPAETDKEEE
jgi:hypothetical protein